MKIERPPWIEWGNLDVILIDHNMSVETDQVVPQSKQLCSASVGRPIAWAFLFWAKVLEVEGTGHSTVTVDFNVTSGTGLAKATMSIFPTNIVQQGFCRFVFDGTPINPNQATKWTSTVRTPPFDDTDAADVGLTVDRIIAERVECNASAFYETVELPSPLRVQVFAGFAPYNMRQEWFKDLEKYGL